MQTSQNRLVRAASIIIGGLISLIGVVMMFRVVQSTFTAASDKSPTEVSITEIAANQAKIAWTSDQSYIGSLDVGTSIDRLDSHYQEIATEKRTKHEVLVTLLSAETTYYFQIEDDTGTVYKNASSPGQEGLPWTFTTKSKQATSQPSNPIPTRIMTLPRTKITPTPIQSILIPDDNSGSVQGVSKCDETDCEAIHDKLGNGCSIVDYRKCLQNEE